MSVPAAVGYRVVVMKDPETGSVVAEIPALHLADYGADVPEALGRLQAMLSPDGQSSPAHALAPSFGVLL
jgi:hypothetical protein